jgi:hypothetical protein
MRISLTFTCKWTIKNNENYCIKHNVSKVRWAFERGSLYLIKKKKRMACVGYSNRKFVETI